MLLNAKREYRQLHSLLFGQSYFILRFLMHLFNPVDSLTDLDNLPDPDILAAEIVENIEAGLDSFREIVSRLEME